MKLWETFVELESVWAKAEAILNGDIVEDAAGVPVTSEDALNWLEECLQKIESQRDEKAIRIGCFLKSIRHEAAALKEEKLRLQKRQQSCELTIKRLSSYLEQFLPEGTKIKDPRCVINWRKSEAVNCWVDPGMLPPKFQRLKVQADLSAIKTALKSGEEIAGATLETRNHIQIK